MKGFFCINQCISDLWHIIESITILTISNIFDSLIITTFFSVYLLFLNNQLTLISFFNYLRIVQDPQLENKNVKDHVLHVVNTTIEEKEVVLDKEVHQENMVVDHHMKEEHLIEQMNIYKKLIENMKIQFSLVTYLITSNGMR